jgi:hypothetical protein
MATDREQNLINALEAIRNQISERIRLTKESGMSPEPAKYTFGRIDQIAKIALSDFRHAVDQGL